MGMLLTKPEEEKTLSADVKTHNNIIDAQDGNEEYGKTVT